MRGAYKMKNSATLTIETMLSLLNGLDAFIYATDPDNDEILFMNEPMKKHYGLEGDLIGRKCYEILQEGMTSRCEFCPCHELEKNPNGVVEWTEHSTLTKRVYKNTDRLINWIDGKKIHVNQSVDITTINNRDKLLQSVNDVAALMLSSDNDSDIATPLIKGMALIGRSINADRLHIWRNENRSYVCMHSWFNDTDDERRTNFNGFKISYEEMPEWEEKFLRNEVVGGSLSNVSQKEQMLFSMYGAKTAVLIPLFVAEKFWGFFAVDSCTHEREFLDEEINILRAVSLMMANAISRSALIAEMNEAHERSMLMLDTAPICAQIWAKDLSTIDCNQAGIKLYGFKDKQEYIDRFITCCSPEYQPCGERSDIKAVRLVHQAFEEGFVRFDWMHKMPDDDILIPADITLVRSKYKNIDVVIGYTRDMREQRALLAKLNEESTRFEDMAHLYKSILDAIPLPVSVTDKDRNWTFVNAALENLIGKKAVDLIGNPCSTCAAEICNTEKCGIECALRGEKSTYYKMNGLSFLDNIEILRDLDGAITGFIEVTQDITQIEKLTKQRAEAEIASQSKSSFLANMSHEIRTPMNAILGVTEILMQQESLSLQTQEGLTKIHNSGHMLLGIINDILDFSKIEAGKLEIIMAEYTVAELISDSSHLNIMRIESKPISFNIDIDENIPAKLIGDELRIKQVLNNILSNAFKYTEEGTVSFSVSSEKTDNGVMLTLSVRDTGIGMKAEQLETLFDEYSRFDDGMLRGVEGTGLGMAITQHLVKLMGGNISVESKYGFGSVFVVKLPQKVVGTEIIGEETAEGLRQFRMVHITNKEKSQILRDPMPYGSVLVVDDVEPNLYVAEGLMKPYGLKIETVMSGDAAIEKIKEGNIYDIIFMDHMMPIMDGIQTTQHIRALGYTAPIVALTANALTGQSEMFLKSGFDEFISKPIDTRRLNLLLNKLVRDKQPPEVLKAARVKKEEAAIAAKNTSVIISELSKINGLNVSTALSVLGGLEDVYEKTVRLSARLLPESIKKMDRLLDEDLKKFAIEIHGLKGVFRSIGAGTLSAKASRLEFAALDGEKAFCDENYHALRFELMDFIQQLDNAISQKVAIPKEKIDSALLANTLKKAISAAEGYDAINAAEILAPLKSAALGNENERLLEQAVFALEEFNCPVAVESLKKIK
jgi:PAS domain S-box-containing protein